MKTFDLKIVWTALGYLLKAAVLMIFIFPFLWMISTSLQTFRETMTFPPTWIPASPQWGISRKR